jgi:hypothetical protein
MPRSSTFFGCVVYHRVPTDLLAYLAAGPHLRIEGGRGRRLDPLREPEPPSRLGDTAPCGPSPDRRRVRQELADVNRIVSIIAWSVAAVLLSSAVAAGAFIGLMLAIAMSDIEGDHWLKLAFWVLAPVPVAVGVGTLVLGLRGVLPGTRPTV